MRSMNYVSKCVALASVAGILAIPGLSRADSPTLPTPPSASADTATPATSATTSATTSTTTTTCDLPLGLSPSSSTSSLEQLLGRVSISHGIYKFNQASLLESHQGTGSGLDFQLTQAQSTSEIPISFSIYADIASENSAVADNASYVRSFHGYGVAARVFWPGSLTKILHPYAGFGLGKYTGSDEFRNSSFSALSTKTTKTGLGNKIMLGIEISNYIFLEGSITNPGLSSLSGHQLSIGTHL